MPTLDNDTVYVYCRYSLKPNDELIDPTTMVFSTLTQAKNIAQDWHYAALEGRKKYETDIIDKPKHILVWEYSAYEQNAIEAELDGLYHHIAMRVIDRVPT